MIHAAADDPLLACDGERVRAILAAAGLLSDDDWQLVVALRGQRGGSPLAVALDLGLVSEELVADEIARATGRPRFRPGSRDVVSERVPPAFQRAAGALLLEGEIDAPPRLVVGDPTDQAALAALLGQLDGAVPELLVGTRKAVESAIDALEPEIDDDASDPTVDVAADLHHLRDLASEAPVIRYLNGLVERAMELGASDAHIEHQERGIAVRLRVDGLLVEQPPPPADLAEALLCRIKIVARLDIAERRRAQDGRFRIRLRGRDVDVRVSIVPTIHGQDAALRIQDRQRLASVDLADLGFGPDQVDWLCGCAAAAHGILLITGPTGSGKTTTLYAMLRSLLRSERKLLTVEDPVEYEIDGVNHIQVNPDVGLTFGTTLRHVLRHDPDVILVGEIRDGEAAQIAFQAALTGHLVLTTLHTNDVPSSFARLVDMGVAPYLVASAVIGVSAQRLLRRRCTACAGGDPACATCAGLGYRGRIAVMERGTVTAPVKRVLLAQPEEAAIRAALDEAGFEPMRSVAERLARTGVTDDAEVLRVLGSERTA